MDTAPGPLVPSDLSQGLVGHGAGMGHRFGWLYHLCGMGLFLRSLRFEEHSAERIRQAAERGPVVYTLYQRSLLDYLALNKALNSRRLPLAAWANGIRTSLWLPLPFWGLLRSLAALLRPLGPAEDPLRSGWLGTLLASGANAALFMLGIRTWRDRLARRPAADVAEALIAAQRGCERPIQVVPVVVLWSRQPLEARSEVERGILDSGDLPTGFGRLFSALARRSAAIVQAGEPMDLPKLLERYADEPPQRQARILRVALRRYLYREQAVVRGPKQRSLRWMRRLVLSSSPVRAAMAEEQQDTGLSPARIQRRAERAFDKISARMSYRWVSVANVATRLLWNRIYSGVDVREEDMDRIRQAQRRGCLVLLPCHRSHLDYLLVSSILYQHDLALPHIAAGINLSFWPAGPIFRHLGAFFVKRSFKGDRIFPAVFAQYVHQLVRDGHPIEFFIEGGRSRTGKLLSPKLGLLGMVVDALAAVSREDFDVTLLPVNISYEQLAEENAYARELAGEKKKSESITDVVRARRVLTRRYGRVYLRAGTPLSLREALAQLPQPWSGLDRERRNEWLQHVGERVLHRINQEALVLPTGLVALALMAHDRRGIRRDVLQARVERFRAFLERAGARPSASMAWPGWATEEALARFVSGKKVGVFEDEDGPVYQLAESSRVTLEYYKNSLLHFFVPASLLALALRRAVREHGVPRAGLPTGGVGVDLAVAERDFLTLAWMLRHEFVFDPETDLSRLFASGVEQAVGHGALHRDGDALRVVDAALLEELANLLASFVESYWLTLKALHGLARHGPLPKDLMAAIRTKGQGAYAVEEIRRAESLSSANLQNALKAFREEGIFRPEGEGIAFDEEGYRGTLALLRGLLD
ncbi:MAG: 1-acyl-sn-glycerol-3-phosphate acyltransferase [Pseudomonadota bacterium]